MPRIINAYRPGVADAGNQSVANAFSSIGQSMFGNQAQQEMIRQNALKAQRENAWTPQAAEALANNDPTGVRRAGIMIGRPFSDVAEGNLLATSGNVRSIDDPSLTAAALGAGKPMGGTPIGQQRVLDSELSPAYDPATGRPVLKPRGVIAGGNYEPMPTEATEKGQLLRGALRPGPVSSATGMPPPAAPAAGPRYANAAEEMQAIQNGTWQPNPDVYLTGFNPNTLPSTPDPNSATGNPYSAQQSYAATMAQLPGARPPVQPAQAAAATTAPAQSPAEAAAARIRALPPEIRHMIGQPTGNTSFMDPNSRQIYQSSDGGMSIDVKIGGNTVKVPVSGSGLMPIDSTQAVTQNQSNLTREQDIAPIPPKGAAPSLAERQSYDAGGPGALVRNLANHAGGTFNLLPAPGLAASQQGIEARNNFLRGALAQTFTRDSVARERWANQILPEINSLGLTGWNAPEEQRQVVALQQHLREVFSYVQAQATDPSTSPVEQAQLHKELVSLRAAIGMVEAPAPSAGGGSAQPGTGVAQGAVPSPQQRVVGQTYQTPKGPFRWNGSGWER